MLLQLFYLNYDNKLSVATRSGDDTFETYTLRDQHDAEISLHPKSKLAAVIEPDTYDEDTRFYIFAQRDDDVIYQFESPGVGMSWHSITDIQKARAGTYIAATFVGKKLFLFFQDEDNALTHYRRGEPKGMKAVEHNLDENFVSRHISFPSETGLFDQVEESSLAAIELGSEISAVAVAETAQNRYTMAYNMEFHSVVREVGFGID